MSAKINFYTQDINFKLKQKTKYKTWLIQVANHHHKKINQISYIFCNDTFLHKINLEYLSHNTYTDIITFPYHTEGMPLEGEIYISIDRIKENAKNYLQTFEEELLRVMAHGLLHLCGYDDKTEEQKISMSEKEDEAMHMFN
jgi:rRNA maturation RNase YbeY